MRNEALVPYPVIVSAKSGDPDAMNRILAHYSALIESNSRRTLFDQCGSPHTMIDPEIADRIRTKLIEKVIHDFDPYRLPDGETLEE